MKYLSAAFILLFWMIITLILVCTILGILVIVDDDESKWMKIPDKLLDVFKN